MYIHHINVLIEGSEELSLEDRLSDGIQNLLDGQPAVLVSTTNEELIGDNFGRCVKCGEWVSDCKKDNRIRWFSNGAQLDGNWYCDLCLPEDHSNHF